MKNEVVRILIDEAVGLEKQLAADKKRLEQLKARIQAHAYAEMQNKNIKYRRLHGSSGHANVTYKTKFQLLNYNGLFRAVGDIAKDHVKKVEAVEYSPNTAFKAALIAVVDGDYGKEISMADVLHGLGLEAQHIKAAEKRLKGSYSKDKAVLESFGLTGELEEELDAIRRYRTAELVESFFGTLTPLQIDEIKRAVLLEQELAIGLEFES